MSRYRTTSTNHDRHRSTMRVWLLVHKLNGLSAARAAALLATVPAEIAALALARTTPYHGARIVRVLGEDRVNRLIALLPAGSVSRSHLTSWRVDWAPHGTASPKLHRQQSAVEELEELLNNSPDIVQEWYQRE